ncbi:MAG: hypothetical protein WC732_09755 [Candidatus Omnitrophota bacterium]
MAETRKSEPAAGHVLAIDSASMMYYTWILINGVAPPCAKMHIDSRLRCMDQVNRSLGFPGLDKCHVGTPTKAWVNIDAADLHARVNLFLVNPAKTYDAFALARDAAVPKESAQGGVGVIVVQNLFSAYLNGASPIGRYMAYERITKTIKPDTVRYVMIANRVYLAALNTAEVRKQLGEILLHIGTLAPTPLVSDPHMPGGLVVTLPSPVQASIASTVTVLSASAVVFTAK